MDTTTPQLRIRLRGRAFALLVLVTVISLVACSGTADAPTPVIEQTDDWRAAVHRFVEANMQHPAWGLSHSMRDYQLAKELAAEDQATVDDDVLYAAAYLHDVAAFAPFRRSFVDHQDQAARITESLLAGTGFPMSKIEAVRGAIRTHMYDRDPVGPEAIYLHDADALDWLGAIGIARAVALYGPEAARELKETLIEVPSRLVSKAGQARAPQRIREVERFLADGA